MIPGSERAYNDLLDALMALKKEEMVHCHLPPEVAVAEATRLALTATEDMDDLRGAGIEPVLVDSLPLRAGALAYAAARVQMAINQDPDAATRWKAASPEGYELRKYLVKNLSFAFRREPELTAKLNRIREGYGHKDMILDLLSLSILAEENMALLSCIPMFDRDTVVDARKLYDTLSELLAKSEIDPEVIDEARDMFHRAWTFYRRAADEVKAHGQFVFEGTPRYDLYVSQYMKDSAHSGGEEKVDKTADM